MKRRMQQLRVVLARLWRADAPLTATGLSMMAALAAAAAGLWLDPRVITGAQAWLKPAKFAASIAIYSLTLAWIFTYLPGWRRMRRVAGWTTAATLVLEIAIIAVQAGRGTTSHFNVGTGLDLGLWVVMGVAILAQTGASMVVAVALWRQPFEDSALGWALRLGLALSILGACAGGLMTPPTRRQLAEARAAGRATVFGAHTVGAPDGGPGVPGTGWSREHGDLRVAHFLGLHAVQALPLVAFGLRRRRLPETVRARLMGATAASYAGLFGVLLGQALRGQSLIRPDAATAAALTAWAACTAAALWAAAARARRLVRAES